uniref:Solute carrier family 25 member 36b n=1 Tax=Eptatretus burgeri TaxID=7764 RepID=A0A8C4R4I7_EPTBU
MAQRDTFTHLFAGGCGGTVGAIVTCPLEVVKTRLQSSAVTAVTPAFYRSTVLFQDIPLGAFSTAQLTRHGAVIVPGPILCLKNILEKEGPRSLFRGLGPNLVGVAPSRAIYFAAYSFSKDKWSHVFESETTAVYMCSAACAGFTAITATNPIWLVKTRMQLEARRRGGGAMNTLQCIRHVFQHEGVRGFYRGMSASYAGITETIIHFVIYENLKRHLLCHYVPIGRQDEPPEMEPSIFLGMMCAAATSKTCASCIAYPHEVLRTRLREEGSRYRSLWQTFCLVLREEGYRSLYRGLTTQLIRQIPNAAILMTTYELVISLFQN